MESSINSDLPNSFIKFLYSFLILFILLLYSVIQVSGYLLSIYIIKNYNLEEKYPKFKKILNYFQKISIFTIILDVIFIIFILLMCIGVIVKLLFLTY